MKKRVIVAGGTMDTAAADTRAAGVIVIGAIGIIIGATIAAITITIPTEDLTPARFTATASAYAGIDKIS